MIFSFRPADDTVMLLRPFDFTQGLEVLNCLKMVYIEVPLRRGWI